MGRARFALQDVFDDDYLWFYRPYVDGEVAEQEAELVAELLDIAPGARVLDAGCGHGRMAWALAGLGMDVVGVDSSPVFLEAARRRDGEDADGEARSVTVVPEPPQFVAGDLTKLDYESAFDGALCWFSTLGYHDDATERDVLARLRRAVRPGAAVVVEHVPRTEWLHDYGSGQVLVRDGDFLLDRHRFDPQLGRLHSRRFIERAGRLRQVEFSVRLFEPEELRQWMADAALRHVEVLDGDGAPFAAGADRMIAVGWR